MSKLQLTVQQECDGEHDYGVQCPKCSRWIEVLHDPEPSKETSKRRQPSRKLNGIPRELQASIIESITRNLRHVNRISKKGERGIVRVIKTRS